MVEVKFQRIAVRYFITTTNYVLKKSNFDSSLKFVKETFEALCSKQENIF